MRTPGEWAFGFLEIVLSGFTFLNAMSIASHFTICVSIDMHIIT